MHVSTIPACVALGMTEFMGGESVGAAFDLALPACLDRDGNPSRGAALVLADQAAAMSSFATLDERCPMMTLDLRVDWHGELPRARTLSVQMEDAVRSGEVAVVRGRMLADRHLAASVHAAFLIGSFPGGRSHQWHEDAIEAPLSMAPHFNAILGMIADGEAWYIEPTPEMIGARPIPAYHGGFVAAALEAASFERAERRHPVNFEIRYLLPTRADQRLTIRTRVLRSGKQASIIEADALQGADARLVASSRALFLAQTGNGQRIHHFPKGKS